MHFCILHFYCGLRLRPNAREKMESFFEWWQSIIPANPAASFHSWSWLLAAHATLVFQQNASIKRNRNDSLSARRCIDVYCYCIADFPFARSCDPAQNNPGLFSRGIGNRSRFRHTISLFARPTSILATMVSGLCKQSIQISVSFVFVVSILFLRNIHWISISQS